MAKDKVDTTKYLNGLGDLWTKNGKRWGLPKDWDTITIVYNKEMLTEAGYTEAQANALTWNAKDGGTFEKFIAKLSLDKNGKNGLDPAFDASLACIHELCQTACPFVFLHDDLADARGPVFPPSWYEEYILPRYPELFEPIKQAGKRIIFVADGNMGHFLETLRDLGVDGVMLENPATSFERILEVFGDRMIIGGADTRLLTFGEPAAIRDHVAEIAQLTRDVPGFALSSPGGLHGNIPLENLEAYFDARVEAGFTPDRWRAIERPA